MNTSNNINRLIEKYNALPPTADICTDRHMNQLMEFALESEFLDIEGDAIVIAKAQEPFNRIEIERIVGAEDFSSYMAIILPAAAILIDKTAGTVKIAPAL